MHCPYCRHEDSRVVDSRSLDDGSAIRRRRQYQACGKRFTTMETTALTVVKRSGVAEPFDRSKIINGVRKACQGRPVSSDDLAMLAQEVEETVTYRPAPTEPLGVEGQGDAFAGFAFVAHRAVVDVDPELGLVRVVDITTAQDVGKVVNPLQIVGSIEGGVVQGMGGAVLEELVSRKGQVLNPSFADYLIPTAVDVTLASRYLERIGDHGVSVARKVSYLVTGDWAPATDTHPTGHGHYGTDAGE